MTSTVPSGSLPRWLAALFGTYAVAFGLTRASWWLVDDVLGRAVTPLDPARNVVFALSFVGFFAPLLYLFTCALARRWLVPDGGQFLLTVGATFVCAVIAEVGADALFVATTGRPCWLYHVWPVHHGYTSGVGVVMWPLYGAFVHLLHEAIHANPRLRALEGVGAKAILVGVDAMVLEVAANAFALLAFDTWYFRYHRGDLMHFTTAEVFVPYVVAAFLGLSLLERLRAVRRPGLLGAVLLATGATLVAWLA